MWQFSFSLFYCLGPCVTRSLHTEPEAINKRGCGTNTPNRQGSAGLNNVLAWTVYMSRQLEQQSKAVAGLDGERGGGQVRVARAAHADTVLAREHLQRHRRTMGREIKDGKQQRMGGGTRDRERSPECRKEVWGRAPGSQPGPAGQPVWSSRTGPATAALDKHWLGPGQQQPPRAVNARAHVRRKPTLRVPAVGAPGVAVVYTASSSTGTAMSTLTSTPLATAT